MRLNPNDIPSPKVEKIKTSWIYILSMTLLVVICSYYIYTKYGV